MEKRSLSLSGHSTSVALEPEFWRALEEIAASRNQSVKNLIEDIDESRVATLAAEGDAPGLASALRVYVLLEKENAARQR